MRLFTTIFLICVGLSSAANARLVTTQSEGAICNDGKQATFIVSEAQSEDWLVYFEGGGVATSPDSYRNRDSRWKTPQRDGSYGLSIPLVHDFKQKGFNVVVIPYCSSDLFQGAHTNIVDEKEVFFHGRKIVEDVFAQLNAEFTSSDTLVFAGHSAGAIALGFNSDLISRYSNSKVIVDSFWLDTESRRERERWTTGPWVEINKFVYGNMPAHCTGHWSRCFPQRTKFQSMNISEVFPIWNIGDPYIRGDTNAVKRSIVSDIEHYGAGFSIDAAALKVEGFERWGHVVVANQHYTQEFDGITIKMLIENWLSGSGTPHFIKH